MRRKMHEKRTRSRRRSTSTKKPSRGNLRARCGPMSQRGRNSSRLSRECRVAKRTRRISRTHPIPIKSISKWRTTEDLKQRRTYLAQRLSYSIAYAEAIRLLLLGLNEVGQRRGLKLSDSGATRGLVLWPRWTWRFRDQIQKSIVEAAFTHKYVSSSELEAVDRELRDETPAQQSQLFYAIYTKLTEWTAWALGVAQFYSWDSCSQTNPCVSSLFKPLPEVMETWGDDAQKSINGFRLAFVHRIKNGNLPPRLDPDWLASPVVGETVGKKVREAQEDSDEADALNLLFGLHKPRTGPRRNQDRNLYYRIMFARNRHEYRSHRKFFQAICEDIKSQTWSEKHPPNAKDLQQRVMRDTDYPFEKVIRLQEALQHLRGTVVGHVLGRVSPEITPPIAPQE